MKQSTLNAGKYQNTLRTEIQTTSFFLLIVFTFLLYTRL